MNNVIVMEERKAMKSMLYKENHGRGGLNKIHGSESFLLIAAMFVIGTILAFICRIPVRSVMNSYSYDVLVIMIVMELFTNLIAQTGIMQLWL